MKYLTPLLFLFSILCIGCNNQVGWNKWRGPNGDGISYETAWNVQQLDSSKIIWTKNIGFGHSSILVKCEKCYVSGWKEEISGKDTISQSTIYCLDVKSGKEIWKYNYPSANRSFPGPRSTPVIDGNKLYEISWEGKLFCIDAQIGRENWVVDLTADSLTVPNQWGYCPSPVIFQNIILLNLNKSGIALDKKSGKVVWKSEKDQSHFSSVQLISFKGKTVGVFMSGLTLNLVDPLTGAIQLSFQKKSDKGMENDIMMTGDGKLFTSNELLEIGNNSLKSIWINDSIASFFRTGVILNNFAYQFSDNRNKADFYCIDVKTGIPAWSTDLGAFGSVIAVNDKLIILTGKGKVIIADAKIDKFNLLKELQVFKFDDKSKNWCWTTPTFQDGKLYIRNSFGDMACIDFSI